jgi:hypothetical protein
MSHCLGGRLVLIRSIDVAEVEEFCSGRKPIPDTMANELEAFADRSSEVGDTTVKRDLAKKHLGKEGQ